MTDLEVVALGVFQLGFGVYLGWLMWGRVKHGR